jgi:hypothetical protein
LQHVCAIASLIFLQVSALQLRETDPVLHITYWRSSRNNLGRQRILDTAAAQANGCCLSVQGFSALSHPSRTNAARIRGALQPSSSNSSWQRLKQRAKRSASHVADTNSVPGCGQPFVLPQIGTFAIIQPCHPLLTHAIEHVSWRFAEIPFGAPGTLA